MLHLNWRSGRRKKHFSTGKDSDTVLRVLRFVFYLRYRGKQLCLSLSSAAKLLFWNLCSHLDELAPSQESNLHCNQDGRKVKLLCWKSKTVWPCGLVTCCLSSLHRLSFLLKAVNWSEAAAEKPPRLLSGSFFFNAFHFSCAAYWWNILDLGQKEEEEEEKKKKSL